MKKRFAYLIPLFFFLGILSVNAQRKETCIKFGWKFTKGDIEGASSVGFGDKSWQTVSVPHDWAIYGPFDKKYTGGNGGLPYIGVGWYRHSLDVSDVNLDNQTVSLLFDGAMSEAKVYVNGQQVMYWPYGYNSFYVDITKYLHKSGNELAVRLENKPESSRWYPGAGLYRNVHLIVADKIHVPVWGTYVTTPFVTAESATVSLKTDIENSDGKEAIKIKTKIVSPDGDVVAEKENASTLEHQSGLMQHFTVNNPKLWCPEHPYLYKAVSQIYVKDSLVDEYTTRFGIRKLEYIPDKGFFLNGKMYKINGVCMHHDLGALGAAINKEALRHRLLMLKDMGCNAMRTSHNMPAPELVEACDEEGIMLMVEAFDEWDVAKCNNGYHRFFKDWSEKDVTNMVRHYRNDPSVILWSTGNEIPTQWEKDGYKVAEYLQNICHREDPTRPVTCGMNGVPLVITNGFGAVSDIPGFNYHDEYYKEGYDKLPQGLILGSETASTVSSRGVYEFPVKNGFGLKHDDRQSSGYDLEYCPWSNLPDYDFALEDDNAWDIGQFVWTGFDYLGEPTPYDDNVNGWPNHSSVFGIIDLAELPKDRYYLYRSEWNKDSHTLHVLPHWTWPGREGKVTPVYVYTDYPSAKLFINGKSQGIRFKNDSTVLNRYRLMWNEAVYEPGNIKVVAYDKDKQAVDSVTVYTAGKPDHLVLSVDKKELKASGEDLVYVKVSVVDKNGNLCPFDNRLISFDVKGAGFFRAVANGDPACLESFQKPEMHAFAGMLTAIVQSKNKAGEVIFKANAKGVKGATLKISNTSAE